MHSVEGSAQGIAQTAAQQAGRLPHGVARELEAAAQRTGETPALQRARARLPMLLGMAPDTLELYMREIYSALE